MNIHEIQEEETKRGEFTKLLCDLANSQEILKDKKLRSDFYIRLENLYYAPEGKTAFRHFYSDIFSVLSQIKNGDISGSVEILGQNLYQLRKGYDPQNKDQNGNLKDISKSITKLYDHVSLDIARINYSDAGDWKVSQEESLQQTREKIGEVSDQLKHLSRENEKISQEMKKTQRDYITILGIFVSILAAFFSGIGFSSSVLTIIKDVSIYRLILVILLLGWVLFDILSVLFKFIYDMSDKQFHKCWFIGINILFLALIGILFVGWKYNCFGEIPL